MENDNNILKVSEDTYYNEVLSLEEEVKRLRAQLESSEFNRNASLSIDSNEVVELGY